MSLTDRHRVVVIEDEPTIIDVVEYNLARSGFDVMCAGAGDQGLLLVEQHIPSLVVLDLMLPGLSGTEVCRRIRSDPALTTVAVLMLTALGGEDDVVRGLDAGADDYLAKPFSPRELVARALALVRRGLRSGARGSAAVGDTAIVRLGALAVDPERHEAWIDGSPVPLTRTEFRILLTLAARPDRAFSRGQLVAHAIGDEAWVTDRTIDVHVRAIRRKLGPHAELVETVRGVGYRARMVHG